ncbi:MAG: 4Fe-4S dicluster domain-containing protein [Deltaproteobacteria bacterium]|nr:4Fe-4S dicluster domain-containing protein [Deltaproteobacteria bacterium]
MENIEKKLREEAKLLLAEKRVDVIIGYEKGTLPFTATPCFITDPENAEKLVWNACCVQNLAKFVHDVISQHKESQKRVKPEDRKKKVVGVVGRGCATRSIVLHLQEKQYDRGDVVIIGVPCTGYIDGKKLAVQIGGEEVLEGSVEGDQVKVKTASGEKSITLKDVLADNCLTCRFNNPIISDIMIGENAPPMDPDHEYDEVGAFENLSTEERWAYFTKEMGKCIRCYACRQVCPSCYCKVCFVEQSQPRWVGIGADETDTQVFQLMRLFHMVGRCVDCGSCSAVCPMGVDLRKFLKKLDKDGFDLFGNRAGSSMDDPPPLSTYKENDKQDFIFDP